jgi:dTDP-4-dehydrorhamnose reductase
MKVLIIGASSYVGARLFFEYQNDFELLGTYSSKPISAKFIFLDITDKKALQKIIQDFKPSIIIQAANNADARWCEANPVQARILNTESTSWITELCNQSGSKFIYISSIAADLLKNVYGSSKLFSEEIIKSSSLNYLILRPSLILGYSPNTENDRPFNRILKNINQRIPAIYDDSWQFQPTHLKHLADVIKHCINKDISQETIDVGVNSITVSRFKACTDILSPFGIETLKAKTIDSSPTFIFKDLDGLNRLKLPTISYHEMISEIVEEINHSSKFSI